MHVVIPVSNIKNLALRRAVIVVTYPLIAVLAVLASVWNGFLEGLEMQKGLALSVLEVWRED